MRIHFPRVPIPRLFPGPRWSVREANVRSIQQVPRTHVVIREIDGKHVRQTEPLLPDGPARRFLISAAMDGLDVRAYSPAQLPSEGERRYNIWYGPLAPRYDARIPAQVWAVYWDDLVTKAAATRGITQANGGGE